MGQRLGLILLMAGLMFGVVAGEAWAQATPFERLRAAYTVRDADAAAAAYEPDAEVRYEYDGAPVEVHRGREAIRASFAAFFDQLEPGQPVDLNFRVIEMQGCRTVGVYRLRIGDHESYGRFDATTRPSGLFAQDTSRGATKADFDAAPPALLIPEAAEAQR